MSNIRILAKKYFERLFGSEEEKIESLKFAEFSQLQKIIENQDSTDAQIIQAFKIFSIASWHPLASFSKTQQTLANEFLVQAEKIASETQNMQLSAYRKQQQVDYVKHKQEDTANRLRIFLKIIQTFDRTLEQFKRSFYEIYTNTFIEKIEELKLALQNIETEANILTQSDIFKAETYQLAIQNCKTYLNNLLTNQHLLSEACYTQYVIPLIDEFWNFKHTLEQYYQQYVNAKLDDSKIKSTTSEALNLIDIPPEIFKFITPYLPNTEKFNLRVSRFFKNVLQSDVTKFLSIKQVCFGYGQTFFIRNDGAAFMCGKDRSKLFGIENKNILVPTRIQDIPPIKKVITNHRGLFSCKLTLFLCENGAVLTTDNRLHHLSGGPDVVRKKPELLPYLPPIEDIVVGRLNDDSIVMLCKDGSVLVYGDNNFGQLGLNTQKVSSFTLIPNLPRIKAISGNDFYTLFLSENGIVLACGTDYNGSLGFGDKQKQIISPTPVPNLNQVKAISAIGPHSIFLCQNGSVLTCGLKYPISSSLRNWKYLFTPAQFQVTPTLIPNLPPVKAVAAGEDNAWLLCEDGTVMGFGDNYENHPKKISTLPTVKSISTGIGDQAAFLCEDGSVWIQGHNRDGELGLNDTKSRNEPTPVEFFNRFLNIQTPESENVSKCSVS